MVKTYTILGAKGFIGRHLHEHLQKSGANCYAPTRGDPELFKRHLGTVFYCIGLTNDYKDRPFDTVEAHVSLLSQIVSTADYDKIVYLSSTRLYDGLLTTAEETDLVLNPANPRHIYDLSKALGENICLTASKNRACVARLSSVYSDVPDASGFVPDLLRRLKNKKTFELESSSGIVRDYIHINDVISALLAVANQNKFGIVNVACGENISNQEIVHILEKHGCSITFTKHTALETSPPCEIKKLHSLGVNPKTLDFYLERHMGEST